MSLDSERFYIPEDPFWEYKASFWQHGCGLFQWHLSPDNVDICCSASEFDKISWPNIVRQKVSGG